MAIFDTPSGDGTSGRRLRPTFPRRATGGRVATGLWLGLALLAAACGEESADQLDANQGKRAWHSHAEVAERVQEAFEELDGYAASFQLRTVDGNRSESKAGSLYYQKPGKLRYEFTNGDLIVSNGKIMWFYLRRLNAVGKQELTLNKTNADGRPIFADTAGPGLKRLFARYHYRFDTPEQPRVIDGEKYFVLDMEQREKIGGYETIKLFVDAESYLVRRAEGADGYGKTTVIDLSNIRTDPGLEGKLFQYEPAENMRVVLNPLVKEE